MIPAEVRSQRVLLIGATGLVGREVLALTLTDDRVGKVVALTRRPLQPHPKLGNPIVDFERLPVDADWWMVDVVICTLGTTIKDAGSQAAFRKVDHDYPLAVAWHAKAAGARVFALNSAIGADPRSRIFYTRTKGEVEQALKRCGYSSLIFVRPGVLGGRREKVRLGEAFTAKLLEILKPLVPKRYRVVPAQVVARALLNQALSAPEGMTLMESEQLQ